MEWNYANDLRRFMRVEKQSEVIATIINVFASYCRSIVSLCISASECASLYEKYQKAVQNVSSIVFSILHLINRLIHLLWFRGWLVLFSLSWS